MSFPKYPKHKNSGVEWLGDVPEHWEVRRLKFLCEIQTGDKDTENAIEDGMYPFFVRSQTVERINSFAFDCEAVLTAGDGVGVGKVFHYHHGRFDFHQRVYLMNRFRDVSGRFLFHFMKENFYKVALEGGAKSTVDSLRRPLFTNFPVAIPPRSEQRSIVEFVECEAVKIDALVAEQRRLIELLKENRQAVISHAVSKGLNPHAPMKSSGIEWLGDVPEHWRIVPLRWTAKCCSGDGRSSDDVESIDDEINAVRVIGGNGLMGYTDEGNIDHAVLAVGRVGALCGNVHLVPPPAWITDNALILDPNPDDFDLHFLAMVLRSRNLNDIASKTAQPLITGTQVGDQRVPAPPLFEQHEITAFLKHETAKIDILTSEAQRGIELLQERRTALISAAVTGKIDVRGFVEAEAA